MSSHAPVGGAPKRALDLMIALPLAVALTPVMAAIALLVRRDGRQGQASTRRPIACTSGTWFR